MLIWSNRINSDAHIRFGLTVQFRTVIHLLDARRAFHQKPTLLWSVSCVSLVFKTRRAKRGTFHWGVGVKRFTDTEKWNDPWFRRLPPELKCFWSFVLDNCDPAGVWKVDMELANFYIGGSLTEEIVMATMPNRFKQLDSTRWFVPKFIRFQYGELREECRPHMAVIRFLKEHGLFKEYLKGLNTLKDKEKEKDKSQEREGESEGKLVLLRVRRLFGKRETTALDASEQKAWRSAERMVEQTPEEDWALIEWAYRQSNGSANQFRRKDMATLLNNWNCEIDRAKTWKNGQNGSKTKAPIYDKLPPIREVSEEELAAQRKIVREASELLKAEFNR